MKIGIMTFHGAPNHGAALQAYALQTHLKKMGHQPFFINYEYGSRPPTGLLGWIGRTPSNTFEKIDHQLRPRPFIRFQEKHLNICNDRYIDIFELRDKPPEADAYLCGSDQVWNPYLLNKLKDEPSFWLNFGDDNVRRIAYAPSFGVTELKADICNRYRDYAKKFDAISVREKTGIQLLEKIGWKGAFWVPDPTLLLEPAEYLNLWSEQEREQKSWLFSYQIKIRKSPPSPATQINVAISRILGIKIFESYSINPIYNILHSMYLNPVQWLFKLCNSQFVVTNSFHATIFGLLFHRPFITILRSGASEGMNTRIESLLSYVGLEHRAVTEFDPKQIEDLCNEEINWEYSDKKIREFRKIGRQFLETVFD